MYIKRHIEEAVLKRAEARGAVVITGARQVGKTTLLENIIPHVQKVTFDHIPTRMSALNEASAFFSLNPPPLFIDEVQYAPDIFSYIKIEIDKAKKKGMFFLTGSQKYQLMLNVSESLAGRAGILDMLGLSMQEINGDSFNKPFIPTIDYLMTRNKSSTKHDINIIWQKIHRGFMPELVANPEMGWEEFYSDYIKSYLERDVRALAQVGDEGDFLKFMTACATMTGQLLNLSSISRDIGISQPTAKRWLSILETSGVIYLLKPYSNNLLKRTIKTPKLYFLDTGLASYLSMWMTPDTLRVGAISGQMFETFVICEILKSYYNAGKTPNMYYLRTASGQEVDILLCQDNVYYPLECKVSAEPSLRDIKHFQILEELSGINVGEGGVICMAQDLLPLSQKHKIIPVWAI